MARATPKRPADTERFTSNEYKPYVTAIGQLALAWNDLHETLGGLFCTIAGDVFEENLIAVWHSAQSDRAKRAMLEALVKNLGWKEKRVNPKAEIDLKWLLGELNSLEDIRNNAIHAPLASFSHPSWRLVGVPAGIAPDDIRGNRRASKLKGKNLLREYRYCRDATIILRDFAEQIADAWGYTEPDPSWPKRPSLPNKGDRKAHSRAI